MVCCYKAINKAILDRKKIQEQQKFIYLLTLILILINFLCGFFLVVFTILQFYNFYNFNFFWKSDG